MTRYLPTAFALLVFFLAVSCCPSGDGKNDAETKTVKTIIEIATPALEGGEGVMVARYETRYHDPMMEEIRERDKKWKESRDAETGEIRKRQKDKKEKERLEEQELVSSLPAKERPASPEVFGQVFHLPPAPQYYTGTCWSYASTSFLESEVLRISKKKVKLSEMATVYFEYLAKASRFIRERGDSLLAQGSESNAVIRVWKEHGAWTHEAFPGFVGEDPRHDHLRMFRELEAVIQSVEEKSLWDEQASLLMLRAILDRHLGRPPSGFQFEGRTLTPRAFMTEILKINPGDYVDVMSTLSIPFYTKGEFKVPDNWWHDQGYHNVPLDEFYAGLKKAVQSGYSLSIAIDVSEPGKDSRNDVLFIPDYDIPQDRIDQIAREYRIRHRVTTDDHGVHLVGYTEHAGHDWFLVKDSGRASRRGKHKGYFFMRDDYVRLKLLAYTVHKDAIGEILSRFE
jgi:bleomycin hydrolase